MREEHAAQDVWGELVGDQFDVFLSPDVNPYRVGQALAALLSRLAGSGSLMGFELQLYARIPSTDSFDPIGVWGAEGAPLATCGVAGGCGDLGPNLDADGIQAARKVAGRAGQHLLELDYEGQPQGFGLLYLPPPATLDGAETIVAFACKLAGAALARWQATNRSADAKQALESVTQYLRRVIDRVKDGIVVVSPEGMILAANPVAEDQLGYLAIDLVGEPLDRVLPRELTTACLAAITLASRQEVEVTRTVRLRRAGQAEDQDDRILEASFERVQAGPESAAGVLICLKDLGDVGRQEWFLRREEARERDNAAMTRSLLRPLSALRAYLYLLRDEVSGHSRAADLVAAMDLQGEWLQSRLETMSLIDEFRGPSVIWRDQEVPVGALLDRASMRTGSTLASRGVHLEVSQGLERTRVCVDVDRWVACLAYLLDEVSSHVERGGRIVVEERNRRAGNPRVCLRIRGQHPAVSPSSGDSATEAIAHLADVSDGRAPHALTLARTVVHHYGGTLLWDWEPCGAGSVTLTLPLSREGAPTPP